MERATNSSLILYTTEDGLTKIEATFDRDTVWLSIDQMADLFQRNKSTISRHIGNIYKEGELDKAATVAKFATVQMEGERQVERQIEYYNLDVIISVGYRVKSQRGVQFRMWATAILKEFMKKGFVLDDDRLKNLGGGNYFDELLARIRDIRSSEKVFWRKVLEIFEALEFDKTHTKDETIEWYLNVIYLGHGCYGVSTAAQKYFGKTVNELSLAECASLIAITNNPSQYDPYTQPENNKERRNLALDLMCEQGYISKEKRDEAKAEEVKCVFGSKDSETTTGGSDNGYYSWYTDAVIESVISDLGKQYGYDETTATNLIYSGGLQIYSCLDPKVQAKVDAVYGDANNTAQYKSAGGQALRSGITVVDNNTGAVVALAVAVVVQPLQHLLHLRGQQHRRAEAVAGIEGVVEVLDMQVDLEAGLEVAVHHHRDLRIHDRRTGQTAADGREDLLRVDTGHGRERVRLGAGRDVAGDDDLVGQLHGVARAVDVAAVDHGRAHDLQQVEILVKQCLRAAAHDRQRAVDGLGLAAGDRRIHHMDTGLFALRRDRLGLQRGNGAHVDDIQTLVHTFGHAALAEHGCAHVRGIGHHGDDDIALRGDVRIALAAGCTAGDDVIERFLRKRVERRHCVARLQQILAHGSAHDAKTDKTNFIHTSTHPFC